ncbi:MAG: hypothetical protein NTU43_07760 [Bacteroidetes bacterium]|nr:hypothetical protein [Bacteroidota bacterium]
MKTARNIMSAAIMLLLAVAAQAQPGAGGGFGDDPIDVPVDGGLSILAVAGIGYGIKKLKERNKK